MNDNIVLLLYLYGYTHSNKILLNEYFRFNKRDVDDILSLNLTCYVVKLFNYLTLL